MKIEVINPGALMKPQGYAHAIQVSGAHKTLFIGGQNAVDESGNLVGRNDLTAQTLQVLANIEQILKEAGAKYEQVVRFGIYLCQGQDPLVGFQAFQKKWGNNSHAPTITVLFVAALGQPEWLVEIDAIAVIPE